MEAPVRARNTPLAPLGRREQRKATTRAELLAAGRKLFSDKGLSEARVEDLTSTAGIAKGTLYQYFRDKDELVQAVVAAGLDELHAFTADQMQGAGSLADRAARIAAAHGEFFAVDPDLMRVLQQVRGLLKFNAHRWAPLRSLLQRHIERLADLLVTGHGTARLTPGRRRELAALLFGAVSGMASTSAAMDASATPVLRAHVLRRTMAAFAEAYVSGAAIAREPSLNARVARQRRRTDAGPRRHRRNGSDTPDGGAG